ncbi:MAG: agmatine deiminase family protein [Sphingomonas sp.]|uniref:agmatine deiminase family protein n=1 Tax=Sphingomonas sp. CD22 TaxID=3100214 RepID=UPI00121341A7|nr:agmatine deiminase family protein [Sphingomonas sp. CD22]MEA1083813.1 agmatine deiminase family protein [Sphingomonas sp. CD22]RZL56628.1 MAG: agmatine deiminase family protein [Sphingomonas sp.]
MTVVPPPAEWAPHDAVWIGFPSHPELWEEDLDPAREEVVAFARAVHAGGRGETVILVAADAEAGNAASRMAPFAEVVVEPFGDIWLRDTGPILLGNGEACDFGFNGWGGKYDLPGDDTIGMRLAKRHGRRVGYCNWVLEGGAIDGDGTGVVVTTEQCLLNANRNPTLDKAQIEARLRGDLGLTKVVWLGDGLLNDHTDGHVDNLARFVGEGRLALPEAAENDPNWQVYQHALRDARAAGLEVVTIPSPGRVLRDEEVVPASYMNFYIGNAAVVVPLYGAENDAAAVRAVQALFPDREAVGLRADHILTGGGSFHCISQQIPAGV